MKAYGKLVLPGERIDHKVEAKKGEVVDVEGQRVAAIMGLIVQRENKQVFVPVNKVYVPEVDHVVIGLVESVGVTNWFLDINSPYQAILPAQDFLRRPYNPAGDDLLRFLKPGDYVKAKVVHFDKLKNPVLSVQGEGLGKIVSGSIVDVPPAKIPRIIGKKRSMLTIIEERTGCSMFAASNGRVHVECQNPEMEAIAIAAIRMIEMEAHVAGLTEKVARFIDERKGVKSA